MFEKLPVSIPIIDNLGFPSFLTKQVSVSFAINAGAKSKITCKYVFVMEKTPLSAPNNIVSFSEKKIPVSMKMTAIINIIDIVFEKHLSAFLHSFCPL